MLGQRLDGDGPIEPRVVPEIDHAHPAPADLAFELIGANPGQHAGYVGQHTWRPFPGQIQLARGTICPAVTGCLSGSADALTPRRWCAAGATIDDHPRDRQPEKRDARYQQDHRCEGEMQEASAPRCSDSHRSVGATDGEIPPTRERVSRTSPGLQQTLQSCTKLPRTSSSTWVVTSSPQSGQVTTNSFTGG